MFRFSQNTASGHSKWSQRSIQQADPTLPQNTATQWIPSAPLELADLLGFCSWKVAWGFFTIWTQLSVPAPRNHGGCGGWNHGDPDHRMGNSELETWIMTHQKNAPHKMGFSLCCLISPCLKNKVYPEEKTSQIWLFVSFPFWIAMLDDIYHFQTDPSPIYFMAKILTYQTALRPPFLRFAGSEVWYHKLLTPSWYST